MNTVLKKPNAKWYQYSETITLCDHCDTELEIDLNRRWPRSLGIYLAILPVIINFFFPKLMADNLWLWPILFIPTIMMFIIAKKVEIPIVKLKGDERNQLSNKNKKSEPANSADPKERAAD